MTKKKLLASSIVISLILALVALPLAGGCAKPKEKEEVFKWRFHSSYTSTEIASPIMLELCDEIYEETGGRFEITMFWEDDIVPCDEVPRATADGVVEIGEYAGEYFPGVPVGNCDCGVPCLWQFEDPYEFPDVMEELGIYDILREAYAEANLHFLDFEYCGPYPVLYSTVPIYHVEDLDGVKIRAFGSNALVYEAFGASTTYIPGAEIYMAQKLGTIDASSYSADVMWAMSFWEITDYFILPALAAPTSVTLAVNMDAWNSLPQEFQQILIDKFTRSFWNTLIEALGAGIQEGLDRADEGGYEVIYFSDEDMAKIREAACTIGWDDYAAESSRSAQVINIMKSYYGMD